SPGRSSLVMSSVVETSLIIIGRRRAGDSSTPLRCARNDTMEGYLSINETVHSRPNRAAILRGYPAWIRTKRCEEFFDNEDNLHRDTCAWLVSRWSLMFIMISLV